ncbi:hypothetical protein AB0O57_29640 [Streptomyces sp. NPDC091201]|uniref:hypothetical protein n=1 Tax=Streptomyces sp. NPDC091201 TaxID=3155190 RepID=UPI003415A3F7
MLLLTKNPSEFAVFVQDGEVTAAVRIPEDADVYGAMYVDAIVQALEVHEVTAVDAYAAARKVTANVAREAAITKSTMGPHGYTDHIAQLLYSGFRDYARNLDTAGRRSQLDDARTRGFNLQAAAVHEAMYELHEL